MQTTTLGRTGRTVSVAGLGCGGNSRVGLGRGLSQADSARLVRDAIDRGVSLIDTAEAYGTEEVVGLALEGIDRDAITLSTKSRYADADGLMRADRVVANLEASLRRLGLDTVDVFHVHGVKPADYAYVMDEIVPALIDQKARGTIRHIGITESPPNDPRQVMLTRAVHDDVWEVVMVAFHMMNQAPRRLVFPRTRQHGIGTLVMFAVRNIFSRPERLRVALNDLAARGLVPPDLAGRDQPLDFLIEEGGAASLTDAAYRFARHEPGTDVVLFGTGDPAHLRANIASINAGPLPEPTRQRLVALLGELTGIGLDLPDRMQADK